MTTFRTAMLLSSLAGCIAIMPGVDKAWGRNEVSTGHGMTVAHDHAAPDGADVASTPGQDGSPWSDRYSRELEASLHHLHKVWNTGDIAALREYIIGDNTLPTFELDPRTHQPIKLDSKAALDRFIARVVTTQDHRNLITQLDPPVMRCRATATWGVCTEECTVNYKAQSGKLLGTDKLWSTQVAVNTDKGWRWIQWQMSDATPPQSTAIR